MSLWSKVESHRGGCRSRYGVNMGKMKRVAFCGLQQSHECFPTVFC
jgi:hypothetical protein